MKYLAYGSNLSEEIMHERCPKAKLLGTGELDNFRLMFKGVEPTAYATIEEWQGYKVPYVLWEISEDDEQSLDQYECFPRHYRKHVVAIEFGGEKFLAMYYAKDEEQTVGQLMTHYVEVLEEAYVRWKFNRAILDAALKLSDDYYQRKF